LLGEKELTVALAAAVTGLFGYSKPLLASNSMVQLL